MYETEPTQMHTVSEDKIDDREQIMILIYRPVVHIQNNHTHTHPDTLVLAHPAKPSLVDDVSLYGSCLLVEMDTDVLFLSYKQETSLPWA